MSVHRLSRMFALGNFAVTTAVLLSMVIALQLPETSFAQTTSTATSQNSGCVAPSFYSFKMTPASLNTPWNLPLLSTIDGPYMPTVTATGLPTGIELQDQKTTLVAGGTVLHLWVLSGAPLQVGTYTITVTAQNSCGGASSVITLPINNVPTAQGSVCPAGTTGTYPNCATTTISFDQSSLIATMSSPTITGTSNTQNVSLTVQNSGGSTVYASPTTPVSSGRWSVQLSNLISGLYKLYLYNNGLLLIPATLTVAVPSTATAIPTTLTPSIVPVQSSTATAVACAQLPVATMQIGGRGTGVENLQNFLIQKGLLPPGSATGYFGPLTRAAVRQFQVSAGIVSSGDETTTGFGLVGARTRALIGCQSTMAQPPMQRITCPLVPQPVCGTGGTLISLGFDNNGCALGKVCQMPAGQSQNQNRICPTVTNPSCQYGILVSLGTDYDGCSMGSYCQQPQCGYIQQLTSCPAGQTLVSGTDQYGCPNVSYCF